MTELDRIFAVVESPEGRRRALEEIRRHKGPVYGTDPNNPEVIIETMPDGTKRPGRFFDRKFVEFAE